MRDACLGRAILEAPVDNEERQVELDLVDKDGIPRSGKLYVTVATYDDPKYL